MNIRQMEYVLALADKKNLSDAAGACFITQSALSQSLAKLEYALGVSLFVRRKNQWSPTASGELLLETSADILKRYREFLDALGAASARDMHGIRLGIPYDRSAMVFPQVYSRFLREFPEVPIKLTEGYFPDLHRLAMEGQLDIALAIIPFSYQRKERRVLRTDIFYVEDVVLVVPPSHKFATRAEDENFVLSIKELENEKFICHGKTKTLTRLVGAAFKRHGVTPKELFEVTNYNAVLDFVSNGVGIAFLPRMFAIANPAVRIVPIAPGMTWKMGVVYRKNKELAKPEQRLVSLLLEEMQKRQNEPFARKP
jgi:DNA-binding transcriptional LysR family regulator